MGGGPVLGDVSGGGEGGRGGLWGRVVGERGTEQEGGWSGYLVSVGILWGLVG